MLDISFTEDVAAIGEWRSTLQEVTDIPPFTGITIEREGVQIFAGRVENPNIGFDRSGSTLSPEGFDYTIILTDYLVPSSSIVDSSTNATLTEILSETPIVLSLESIFSYLTDPTELDTTCEFLAFDFSDTCIEFLRTKERSTELDTDVNVLPDPEFRSCFFEYPRKRLYICYGTGGTLRYRHSSDCGATWSGELDTTIAIVGNNFSVAYYDEKVYIFVEDAGGNTDFYRGTILAGGGLSVGLTAANIFPDWMKSGPFFTPNGNIWVVQDRGGALNTAWESVNDGGAWNSRFVGTETLWYMLPKSDGEDMWLIQFDVANTDLELWDWDKSTTTEAFVNEIRNCAGDIIEHVSGCQSADFKIHLAYADDDDDLWYRGSNVVGAWGTERSVSTAMAALGNQAYNICADRYLYAYIGMMSAGGFQVAKGSETTWEVLVLGEGEQGPNVSAPATGQWDGEVGSFFGLIGFDTDLWFYLMDPLGVKIDGGQTTGWFRTDAQTAGGGFINWGYCVADGIQLTDTTWSVLDNADVVLVSGQKVPFDIDLAGVDPAETTIKFLVDMTDTGIDPCVFYIDFSERIDEVSIELDYEHVYTAMRKWAAISGAEYWVTEAGGVYTLHVAETRGSDKSNIVVLKNGKTGLFPDVEPNIKIVSRNPDWSSYVNEVRLLGVGTPPTRAEGHIINEPGVDEHGPHMTTVRDLDVETDAMAQTRASEELLKRGVIVERVAVQFLDEYDPTGIEVGDTVRMVAEFGDDANTKIDENVRIVKLSRSWDSRGETVSAEVINNVQAVEFYNRLVRISDLERWV